MSNKKGFTVIELIVAFIFVMIISVSMLKLLLNYQEASKTAMLKQDLNLFNWKINSIIMKDVNKDILRNITNCNSSGDKEEVFCKTLHFRNSAAKDLKVIKDKDEKDREIFYYVYGDTIFMPPEVYYTTIKVSDKSFIRKDYVRLTMPDGAGDKPLFLINLPMVHDDIDDEIFGINLVLMGS